MSHEIFEQPIHCHEDDLLLALRDAFVAGQESPYELMSQEVNRILNILQIRIAQRSVQESLRKYMRYVEESKRVGTYDTVEEAALVRKRYLESIL